MVAAGPLNEWRREVVDHVLVVGGAGYVGAHACKAVARAGFVPVTFDNLATGWEAAVKFGPFVRGDLMDRAAIDAAAMAMAIARASDSVGGAAAFRANR